MKEKSRILEKADSDKSRPVSFRDSFGEGKITHVFGSGEKISLAIKFAGMGPKILDPRLAPLKLIDQ